MRTTRGMTVVELLVSAVLVGLTMAAVGELAVLNTYSSTKLVNATDGQYGCSRAIRRIGEDVRMSSAISLSYTPSVPVASWPPPPYISGPQTLVLQQPTAYDDATPGDGHSNLNGFPLLAVAGAAANQPQISCLDTVVYQIVADPTYANVYQLQVARFPGIPNQQTSYPTNVRIQLAPQVVLTGLVGPLHSAGGTIPTVFQYLSSNNMNAFPPTAPTNTTTAGVYVDFEVQSPVSGLGANVQHSGAHIESYLKCAISAHQTNQ